MMNIRDIHRNVREHRGNSAGGISADTDNYLWKLCHKFRAETTRIV